MLDTDHTATDNAGQGGVGNPGCLVRSLGITQEQTDRFLLCGFITTNYVLKREVAGFALQACLANTSKEMKYSGIPNKSIAKIDSALRDTCRGPMLLYVKDRNLDTMDLRHFADYIRCEAYRLANAELISPGHLIAGERVEGVRINCLGDTTIIGRPAFEAVSTSPMIYIHDAHEAPVGNLIGIPLDFGGADPMLTLPWRGRTIDGDEAETNRGYMLINPGRNKLSGSTIAMRKDGRPLYVAHLEALAVYCTVSTKDIDPSQSTLVGGMDLYTKKQDEAIRRRASKEGFMDFFGEFKRKYRLDDLPSPYDL
jgi:hypothetical protein